MKKLYVIWTIFFILAPFAAWLYYETFLDRVDLSVCAIAKNEAPYIKEWLDYHQLAGVKRFYIYDNESTDNLKDVLQPYIDQGVVVYRYYPGALRQMPAYNDCVKRYGDKTKWMAFIDLDEFIVPVEKDSIPEFLKDYEDFPGVGVNWVMFDSNGHNTKPQGGVIENYTRVHADDQYTVNHHIKSILQPKKCAYIMNPHFCIYYEKAKAVTENKEEVGNPDFALPDAFTKTVSVNKIRINHYYTKSREEYMERLKKGRADIGGKKPFFEDRLNFVDHKQDTTILSYIEKIKNKVKESK